MNFRTYIKAILDEAIEQEFLGKNPARKLEIPRTRKPSKRALSMDEIAELLRTWPAVTDSSFVCSLSSGLDRARLFALRRDDRVARNSIRIDESVSPISGLIEPKTEASASCVWVPDSLVMELDFWMDAQADKSAQAFIFPSRVGTPISANNWLRRTLKKAGEQTRKALEAAGIELGAGFLRNLTLKRSGRTCATHMQHLGSVKDVQAHLRHSRPNVTAEVYMQEIPTSVRSAVELLDRKLSGQLHTNAH